MDSMQTTFKVGVGVKEHFVLWTKIHNTMIRMKLTVPRKLVLTVKHGGVSIMVGGYFGSQIQCSLWRNNPLINPILSQKLYLKRTNDKQSKIPLCFARSYMKAW